MVAIAPRPAQALDRADRCWNKPAAGGYTIWECRHEKDSAPIHMGLGAERARETSKLGGEVRDCLRRSGVHGAKAKGATNSSVPRIPLSLPMRSRATLRARTPGAKPDVAARSSRLSPERGPIGESYEQRRRGCPPRRPAVAVRPPHRPREHCWHLVIHLAPGTLTVMERRARGDRGLVPTLVASQHPVPGWASRCCAVHRAREAVRQTERREMHPGMASHLRITAATGAGSSDQAQCTLRHVGVPGAKRMPRICLSIVLFVGVAACSTPRDWIGAPATDPGAAAARMSGIPG